MFGLFHPLEKVGEVNDPRHIGFVKLNLASYREGGGHRCGDFLHRANLLGGRDYLMPKYRARNFSTNLDSSKLSIAILNGIR